MGPRSAAFSMLAVAGVTVGHLMAYALAHPGAAARDAALGGHAYLPAAASVVVPLGVVAALVWAVRTSRELGLAGTISFRQLAAAQIALFVVQEVVERAVVGEGIGAVVGERGVWVGLVAQLVVAHLAIRSIDAVRRVVRGVRRGGRVLRTPPADPRPDVPASIPTLVLAPAAVGLRAPPVTGALR